MNRGLLHWLVGPHPWAKRHRHGLVWLTLFPAYGLSAMFFWINAALFRTGCGGDLQCGHDRCDAAAFGWVFLIAAVILTIVLTWFAEERRSKAKPPDDKRSERIAAMEIELGLVEQ